VLLVVDASVQIEELGGGAYFVIKEAESGAQATLASLHKYTEDSGITIRGEAVSVCGARLNTNDLPLTVADSVGGPKRQAQQPLWVSESIANDPQYVSALGVVSTYALERAAISDKKKKDEGNVSSADNASPITTMDNFRDAAKIIKDKTQASSVLFLGVLGKSRSEGKAAAQNIARFAVGMGVAIATAGLGTGYYLILAPGGGLDGMVMEGALIDLESGQLTWSNAVKYPRDPIHPENMAKGEALDLLFHNIMFKPEFVQPTPPLN
jgi:hypothetical protein